MSGKWTYECTHCRALLNPAGPVTMLAKVKAKPFIMAFHPEPGNYQIFLPDNVAHVAGELWEFNCPVCRKSFRSGQHETLCEVVQIIAGARFRLLFSRVAGERATYVISGEEETTSLGDDSERYDDTVRIKTKKQPDAEV